MTGTSNNGRPTMASLGYTEQFTSGSEQGPEPPVAKRHWGNTAGPSSTTRTSRRAGACWSASPES